MRNLWIAVGLMAQLCLTGFAEEATSTAEVKQESESKIVGLVDLRPSWLMKKGTWDTENTARAGYQFNKTLQVDYTQYFNTNLRASGMAPLTPDTKFAFDVGFVRALVNDIYTSTDKTVSLSYQAQVYTPTNSQLRDAGMITYVRNYIMLKKVLNDSVSLSAMELVIPHIYSQSGSVVAGVPTANPIYENRIYLIADFTLIKDTLTFSLPLMFNSTRYRDYASGATLNNRWQHVLWTWPELIYSVTPNVGVGLSYYSDNFIKDDFSGLTIKEGLEGGVTQFVVQASL
jgi:hypothetical protein